MHRKRSETGAAIPQKSGGTPFFRLNRHDKEYFSHWERLRKRNPSLSADPGKQGFLKILSEKDPVPLTTQHMDIIKLKTTFCSIHFVYNMGYLWYIFSRLFYYY